MLNLRCLIVTHRCLMLYYVTSFNFNVDALHPLGLTAFIHFIHLSFKDYFLPSQSNKNLSMLNRKMYKIHIN